MKLGEEDKCSSNVAIESERQRQSKDRARTARYWQRTKMYSERYKERGGEGERQLERKGDCERD